MEKFSNKIINYVKNNTATTVIWGVVLLAFILGTFFDFQISSHVAILRKAEYYSPSLILRFFETFGEAPVFVIVSFALAVQYNCLSAIPSDKLRFFGKYFLLGSMTLSNFLVFMRITEELAYHFGFIELLNGSLADEICYLLASMIFDLLLLSFVQKYDNRMIEKLFVFSVIIIIASLSSQFVVRAIKFFSSRARYRALWVIDDYSEYTPWYAFRSKISVPESWLVLGIEDDAYSSFPSGHASSSSALFALLSLPTLFTFTKKQKTWLFVSVYSCVSIIAISRLLMGAHYLTDVTFAMITTYLCYIFAVWLTTKKLKVKITINDQPLDNGLIEISD